MRIVSKFSLKREQLQPQQSRKRRKIYNTEKKGSHFVLLLFSGLLSLKPHTFLSIHIDFVVFNQKTHRTISMKFLQKKGSIICEKQAFCVYIVNNLRTFLCKKKTGNERTIIRLKLKFIGFSFSYYLLVLYHNRSYKKKSNLIVPFVDGWTVDNIIIILIQQQQQQQNRRRQRDRKLVQVAQSSQGCFHRIYSL